MFLRRIYRLRVYNKRMVTPHGTYLENSSLPSPARSDRLNQTCSAQKGLGGNEKQRMTPSVAILDATRRMRKVVYYIFIIFCLLRY
jgi:hypothetical protein